MIKEKIQKLVAENFTEIVEIRRHLHMHPELSFQEYKTSEFVFSKLQELGLNPVKITGTGVCAIINGKSTGKNVAIRADMDALPLSEKNNTAYVSRNPGVMHACGHDVHTACLLGAAKVLSELKGEFSGSIRFIFQHAEEKSPGGADAMIRAGVLENPDVDIVIAQHVFPELETGQVGFHAGSYLASSDEIYITIKGKGGHAAMPWKLIDPVTVASQVVISLQQLVSRHAKAMTPTVLSFGRFIGDGVLNALPDEVRLEGTFRTFDEGWRKEAHEKIMNITKGVATAFGAVAEIEIRNGYPSLSNDPELTKRLQSYAGEYLGKDKVFEVEPRMTSEDFSYFALAKPACLFRLGSSNSAKGINAPLHNASFDVDESCIEIGAGLLTYMAVKETEK